MRRIHRFIHVARISATAGFRVSNLGQPNVEMELPAANDIDLPAGASASEDGIRGAAAVMHGNRAPTTRKISRSNIDCR